MIAAKSKTIIVQSFGFRFAEYIPKPPAVDDGAKLGCSQSSQNYSSNQAYLRKNQGGKRITRINLNKHTPFPIGGGVFFI